MTRFQKVDAKGREQLRARDAELAKLDLDQRNKQSEQWATKRLLTKVVKDVK